MPRENSPEAVGTQSTAPRPGPRTSVIEVSDELKEALRPWVNVDEVGSDAFCVWLRSVLPLISPARTDRRGRPSSDLEGRVRELAAALAECSGDRARTHFQAAQYYRENQVLARRVKALEAALKVARQSAPNETSAEPEAEAEEASRRYLPPELPSEPRPGRGSGSSHRR